MRLVANLYRDIRRLQGVNALGLFGFRQGQRRPDSVMKNALWFNGRDEEIGQGDLNAADIRTLMQDLLPGELFVAAHESDVHSTRRTGWVVARDPVELLLMETSPLPPKRPSIIEEAGRLFMFKDQAWVNKPPVRSADGKYHYNGATFTVAKHEDISLLCADYQTR